MTEPFASWLGYRRFRREVTSSRRFFGSPETRAFLSTLSATAHRRSATLAAGRQLFRAQVAHAEHVDPDIGPLPRPAPPERMVPRPDVASDGRANPEGIPRLYMAGDRHTAIAEVRPWIGSLVSVAIMRTARDLRLIDCRAAGDDGFPLHLLEREATPDEREAQVWRDVSRAFREPVLRGDDRAGYAPTQVIAELLEHEGFDGVAYGSGFGRGATNLAIFDMSAAEQTACEIHEVKGVTLEYEEVEAPYFLHTEVDGSTMAFRNVIAAVAPADSGEASD